MNALAYSGLYDIVALTIFQRNVAFGPWGKAGNMQELWEVGLEMMATLSPDDVFLLKMRRSICEDRGWTSAEATGRAAH